MTERMTEERLVQLRTVFRAAFETVPIRTAGELYEELCAERKRYDTEAARREALALELTVQLQEEKEKVDEARERTRKLIATVRKAFEDERLNIDDVLEGGV